MSRTIEMVVAPDGKTTVQTKGYAGGECLQASEFLEQALGPKLHEDLTGDFYQSRVSPGQVQQKR